MGQADPAGGATLREDNQAVLPHALLWELNLSSIGQVNKLPRRQAEQIYRHIVPPDLLRRFRIDPDTLADDQGRPLFTVEPGPSSVELWLHHAFGAEDPVLYGQLADTLTNQIEVMMFVINDPHSKRFDTDRLPDGTSTYFGTLARNVEAEVQAMEAGLAPGQIHRGLRVSRRLLTFFEQLVGGLHHDAFYIQPLAYHNAIYFERLGFAYVLGRGRMEWIHREFLPGGLLHSRLDNSSPFRCVGAGETVRGRSWAVQDGILGEPFTDVKMYKRVGIHAGVVTFPNAAW